MICQVCKGLSSPKECDQVNNLRAPLDSTPIYPIALSRSYLCLEHSTWVRWWLSWSLQVDHLSWLCLLAHAWWRLLQMLPHTPLWEGLARLCLHISFARLNQRISSDMHHIELALHLLLLICMMAWGVNMIVHSIFYSKPYLQWAQLYTWSFFI